MEKWEILKQSIKTQIEIQSRLPVITRYNHGVLDALESVLETMNEMDMTISTENVMVQERGKS
jgi:hypothetical protein